VGEKTDFEVEEWLARLGELNLAESNDLETRALCGAVVRSAWGDLERAKIRMSAHRWTSPGARMECFSAAARTLLDLERALVFSRSRRFDFWTALMDFNGSEIAVMREQFTREAEPIARDLRRTLEEFDLGKLRRYRWKNGGFDA